MSLADHLDHAYGAICQLQIPVRELLGKAVETASNHFSPAEEVKEAPGIVRRTLADELRVVSWNIYEARHEREVKDHLKRIRNDYDPHVIMLQEAPAHFIQDDQFDALHRAYAPAAWYTDGRTKGNLTLSQVPIAEARALDLPIASWKYHEHQTIRRNALYTRIDGLGIWNTHLEFHCTPTRRAEQMRQVLERDLDEITVIGADANTLFAKFGRKYEPVLELVNEYGFIDPMANERRPFPQTDYIFIGGAEGSAMILDMPRGISDHKPILGTIKLD